MNRRIPFVLSLAVALAAVPAHAGAQWLPFPPRYPYPAAWDTLSAAVRVDIDQKDAEVYIDGYYAGIVDDFDGTFQRLRTTPGGHQIAVWRPGFHTIVEDIYLRPDAVYRMRQPLRPLAPGEPEDARPAPVPPPNPMRGAVPALPGPAPRPPASRSPEPEGGAPESRYGTLVIQVQPEGAVIEIDGDEWQGPENNERLVVQLPEGAHHVDVRKDGYATVSSDVDIERGQTVPLNVSLASR